jgi:uncharacterized membrane protein YhaH (DUF805 family)
MRISEATKTCFGKFKDFSGRASRSEFWKFVLFISLANIPLIITNSALFGPTVTQTHRISVNQAGEQTQNVFTNYTYDGGWLSNIFMLAMLLPLLAVVCRRMHDIGRPGWHALLPAPIFPISYALFYLSTASVPIDPSTLPAGLDMRTSVRLPQSISLFFAGWSLAFGSIVWVIVWLARRSDAKPNRFDPRSDISIEMSQ